jgi:FAD/FMN-containing dehydrogenase
MITPLVSSLVDHDALLLDFAESIGADGAIAVRGGSTRWNLGGPSTPGTRVISAPTGIVSYSPEEMTVRVRAGTEVGELHAALAERGQRTALVERGGTVGGAIVVGENGFHVLGRGTMRSSVLQVRYVSAEGRVINGGGPTVKNVTGFDLPRLMVGSLGTLGLLAEVILRTNPIPASSVWLAAADADPFVARDALQRPSAVLCDGARTWVLLEGHRADIGAQRSVLAEVGAYEEVEGPPDLPPHRWSLTPADLRTIATHDTGSFVAVVGVGLVFAERPQPLRTLSPSVAELHHRMKTNFDPTGRLNPGRDPGRR